jgi:3-hydroxybutyryl-CoA dehydrogenase
MIKMTIAVWGSTAQEEELAHLNGNWEFKRLQRINERCGDVVAYFILEDVAAFDDTGIVVPIFVNSVVHTLAELNAPHWIRINGWPTFLQRTCWEAAGDITDAAIEVAAGLNVKLLPVADATGLVAARTISMLINEAWYAWSEGVSTKEEIDVAMRLGTNYPYGLFEWGEKIGLSNIVWLLQKLQEQNSKYLPCAALQKASTT